MSNVTEFVPQVVGEGVRFNPDQMFQNLIGADINTVTVIIEDGDGNVSTYGNCNRGESLVLMERAKRFLVFGDE